MMEVIRAPVVTDENFWLAGFRFGENFAGFLVEVSPLFFDDP